MSKFKSFILIALFTIILSATAGNTFADDDPIWVPNDEDGMPIGFPDDEDNNVISAGLSGSIAYDDPIMVPDDDDTIIFPVPVPTTNA